MMRLPSFRYYAPASASEAVRILACEGPRAQIVAGGTDLFPNMKRRHQLPTSLVSLRAVPALAGISGEAGSGLRVGPCTTLTDLCEHPAVRASYPSLAYAAGVISTPILRNMGTIGGNICLDTRCNYYDQSYEWRRAINFCMKCEGDTCWVAPSSRVCLAVNSSDTAPLLCAIGARLRLLGYEGEREIGIRELYRKDGIHYLDKRPDEILTEIRLPPIDGWAASYKKLARRAAFDFPVVGVAAAIWREPDGVIRDARIYINAVASAPIEALEAQRSLIGNVLTLDGIKRAAELAAIPAKPMDNTDLDYAWRKKMVRVYTDRALKDLLP